MANIKLVGSRLTKISAERNPDFSGDLSLKTNIAIKSINKMKEPKDTAEVIYLFEVDYNELGKVSIEGKLFISAEPKTLKVVQKAFDDKDAQSDEYMAITNLILQKSSIKAFQLEDELGLPIHIKLPTLNVKKE